MRLVDADALIHELNNSHYPGASYVDAGISIAIGKVCDAPTIEERKNGKWISPTPEMIMSRICGSCEVLCSACKNPAIDEYDFCPNCGADMMDKEGVQK